MILRSVLIENLRNHEHTRVDFGAGINVFYGLNGAGKTTILEAVAIVGLSKTFLPTPDAGLIRQNADFYRISVAAISDVEAPYKVVVQYRTGGRKLIGSSLGDSLTPKDIIGELPVVVLSPDFKDITFGAPQDRRRFVDALLAQASKRYSEEAINLKKILKQRNAVLAHARSHQPFDTGLFAVLTEYLIQTGAEIISRRSTFVREFAPIFREAYRTVAEGREDVDVVYLPDSITFGKDENSSKERAVELLATAAERYRHEELRRGVTLFGPQKDDIGITVNGAAARDVASQGQHKSLLIGLKAAEFSYLRDIRGETPIALFDDIFSELDARRSANVLAMIRDSNAQTLITTTAKDKAIFPAGATYFSVENGNISGI